MKRSDLPTETVLAVIHRHGVSAFEELCRECPEKAVLAAFERDVRKALLDYGVCITRPWIRSD